jgi:hypothetical protein
MATPPAKKFLLDVFIAATCGNFNFRDCVCQAAISAAICKQCVCQRKLVDTGCTKQQNKQLVIIWRVNWFDTISDKIDTKF